MFEKSTILSLVSVLVWQIMVPNTVFANGNRPTLPQTGATIVRTALIGIVLVGIGVIIIIIKRRKNK